jgi:transcriptional regulator with XRE-family HTH domain
MGIPAKKLTAEGKASANGTPVAKFQLGTKIKHLRLLNELRMADLAERAECSESLLSKIENGRVTPSLNLLNRVAAALGTTVSELFASDERLPHVVLKRDARPVIASDRIMKATGTKLQRLTPVFEGALLQARIIMLEPGGRTLQPISHPGEVIGYVVRGELELVIDSDKHKLSAEDAFHFRAEQPHGFRNTGKTIAEVVWINTPPTF